MPSFSSGNWVSHPEYAALPSRVAESRQGPCKGPKQASRQSTLGSQTTDTSDDVYEDARETWTPDPFGRDLEPLVLPPDPYGNVIGFEAMN